MQQKWKEEEYFSNLNIPNNWNSLEDFVDWYMASKMPIIIPEDSQVYVNENSTSIVFFRHGNFQVELYITFPGTYVEPHFHPGMEIITMQIGKMNKNIIWGSCSDKLIPGKYHEADFRSEKGCVFFTFERWFDEKNMTSASVNWKGKTVGKKHIENILAQYPNSFVNGYYVDVSREKNEN